MTDSISTTVWPGPTHFGFGAAGMAGQDVRTLQADSVFILTNPRPVSESDFINLYQGAF